MKQRKTSCLSKLVWVAAFTLFVAARSFAQEPVSPPKEENNAVETWTEERARFCGQSSCPWVSQPVAAYPSGCRAA
jgi:hypothetical protein